MDYYIVFPLYFAISFKDQIVKLSMDKLKISMRFMCLILLACVFSFVTSHGHHSHNDHNHSHDHGNDHEKNHGGFFKIIKDFLSSDNTTSKNIFYAVL